MGFPFNIAPDIFMRLNARNIILICLSKMQELLRSSVSRKIYWLCWLRLFPIIIFFLDANLDAQFLARFWTDFLQMFRDCDIFKVLFIIGKKLHRFLPVASYCPLSNCSGRLVSEKDSESRKGRALVILYFNKRSIVVVHIIFYFLLFSFKAAVDMDKKLGRKKCEIFDILSFISF